MEEDINEPTQKALEMASVSNAIEFYLRAIAIPVISRNSAKFRVTELQLETLSKPNKLISFLKCLVVSLPLKGLIYTSVLDTHNPYCLISIYIVVTFNLRISA